MEKTNYEKILAQFDEALKEEIQDKCLYAVLDVAFQQGYAEGYRDALTKSGNLFDYFTVHPLEGKNEEA